MRSKLRGSLSRTHSSLGSVKPVSTGLAVQRRTLFAPTVSLIQSTCALAALVAPDQRRPDHLVRLRRADKAVHLAREPDAAHVLRR